MYRVIVSNRVYKDTVALFFQSLDRAIDMERVVEDSNMYFLAGRPDVVQFDEARKILSKRSAKQMAMCNELADMLQEYLEDMDQAFREMTKQ